MTTPSAEFVLRALSLGPDSGHRNDQLSPEREQAHEYDREPVQVHAHHDHREKPKWRRGDEAHNKDEGMRAETER